MKEAGKVAMTTMREITEAFGCSLADAISNSASIYKALEVQKHNRTTLTEKSKALKL